MVKTGDVSDRDANLAELVALATSGTQDIVTRLGNAVARLVPVDATLKPRVPDLHPGALKPADDFDALLPDDFWVGEA
jgi:antitoxin (DNA-binding transcriptional repressor) of toxin-antitoxin stability system